VHGAGIECTWKEGDQVQEPRRGSVTIRDVTKEKAKNKKGLNYNDSADQMPPKRALKRGKNQQRGGESG